MIVLDSNVLSALMRDAPDEKVERWLDQQTPASVWTTSITIFELHFGIQLLQAGKRRTQLAQILKRVLERMEYRIAPLDGDAAERAAELMALGRKQGRSRELRDTLIAGIALARHASLATRNTAHFEGSGIALINPWVG
jgi:toxin FitB